MRNRSPSRRFALLATQLASLVATPAIADPGEELFERTIRPYLVERCYSCHATHSTRENGLAVDWAGGLAEGGYYGPAVVPGDPDASAIMLALKHEDDLPMPKGGPKPPAKIVAAFDRWIRLGAPDPRREPPSRSCGSGLSRPEIMAAVCLDSVQIM